MTARALAWFEDDDPRELRRWLLAAAVVVACHAALIGGYFLWHPRQQEVGDETSAVAVEVTIAQAEQQEQPKVEEPPPPQATTMDAEIPEEKPPEKVEPTPAPRTTTKVEEQAPRIDPSWQTLLLKQLQRFQNYPSAARDRREQGVVELAFSVDRDGHVLSRRIVASSGHPDLDAEALAVVQRAQPLPAFPPSMTQAQLEVNWSVRFALH